MQTERRICLILDNYSVHKSAFIKKIALHLNIAFISSTIFSSLKSNRTNLETNEKRNKTLLP